MPLRDVIYYGRTIEKLIDSKALYRRKQIWLPTPEFYVFYNGDEPYPKEKVLKLSDAYLEKVDRPMLELYVKVININLPIGNRIVKQCKPLYEYAWFIQRIKEYILSGMSRDDAIIQAVKDCETSGIMADFVRKHGSEAVNMLFTEFNMEDALAVRYEEGLEDGLERGIQQGIEQGIEQGQTVYLIQQVCRKLKKGMKAEAIAEELEEEEDIVKRIYDIAMASDLTDVEKVYQIYKNKSMNSAKQ